MRKGLVRVGSLTIPVVLVPLVWWVLAIQAAPVAQIDMGAEGFARYAPRIEEGVLLWLIPDSLRALGHFTALPYTLLAWTILGSVALVIALRHRGECWTLWSIIGLSFLAGAASQTYGIRQHFWFSGAALAGLAALWSRFHSNASGQAHQQPSAVPWVTVFLTWILWMLLVGQGVLWLSDLAARGPVSLRYIGLRQLDAMWAAALLVMPIAAWGTERFLVVLVSFTALWERRRGPQVLLTLYVLTLVLLITVGSELRIDAQKGYPHISSEAVRLLCALSVAWLMARHFEWNGRVGLTSKAGALVLVIVAGCLAVLVITKDLGPFLGIAVALLPLVLVVLASRESGARPFIKVLIFSVAWLCLAIAVRFLLTDWLPAQSWAPERLVLRDEAMKSPFTSRLDYASQIAWILEAAGSQGFGLGGVPWCGAKVLVGLAACTKSSGVPVQFGSDYVYTATAAVWGAAVAVLLVVLTLSLLALTVWAASRQHRNSGLEQNSARLYAWIVVVGATLLMGQVLVSVAGNVGLIPLSGVTQPFLGLGTAALLSSALWLGFTLGGLRADVQASGWLSQPLNRYFLATVVGMVCFVVFAWGWRLANSQPVQDRLTPQIVLDGLEVIRARAVKPSGPDDSPVPVSIADPACRVPAASLASYLSRLSRHLDRELSSFAVTCADAESAFAAAKWAIGRPKEQALRLLGTPSPALIGVSNPYRLNGCVRFTGGPTDGQAVPQNVGPCLPTPDVAARLMRSSPALKEALGRATSLVRKDTSKQVAHYWHVTPQAVVNTATAPPWADAVGLNLALGDLLVRREPIKTRIGQGDSVTLSVDLRTQAAAQGLIDCYVGPCERLSAAQTQGGSMLEGARARMASVLVVDVPTGNVQAAASGHTPCFEAHHQGESRDGCLPLPQPPAFRPWMVVNQALHGEAMCGSLCKLQASLALLSTAAPLSQDAGSFNRAMRESQTERFIDNLLCADKGFNSACTQARLLSLVKATHDLGGSSACPAGQDSCGSMDLFAGNAEASLPVTRLRLMTDPSTQSRSLLDRYPPGSKTFTAEAAEACFAQGHPNRWRECRGEGLVANIAELFGQGNARTSPAGVAQALLTLAQAAGELPGVKHHQLSLLQTGEVSTDAASSPVSMQHARQLLEALQEPLKSGGTAHVSCLKSITADASLNCNNDGQWVVAGKTGTPLFPHDAMTYAARKQACARIKARPDTVSRRHEWARCVVPPTKWFAYLLGQRDNGQIRWKKAVVVLAERNWNANTGLVDTPFDRGGNVAAELGLRLARSLVEQSLNTTATKESTHASKP
jgi:cell division protein FtsW (lipid II flippase)